MTQSDGSETPREWWLIYGAVDRAMARELGTSPSMVASAVYDALNEAPPLRVPDCGCAAYPVTANWLCPVPGHRELAAVFRERNDFEDEVKRLAGVERELVDAAARSTRLTAWIEANVPGAQVMNDGLVVT